MPRLFLIFGLSFFLFQAKGQSDFCGQKAVLDRISQNNPEWKIQFQKNQEVINRQIQSKKTNPNQNSEPDLMIPVVFHILHQNGAENISDAQVQDQIRILNRDYQKKNADTANVVSAFQDIIAHVGFGFKLARIDPQGNCTNGIIRHLTPKTNWDANNLNDFTFSWPRDKYLNIYVVKTINIAATAYAFLPGTPIPASADVIVSLHNMVGSIGTGTISNSRVLTHEVGHWFGLHHIWGTSNQPGVVCGDDLVEDTPETKGFSNCATSNTGICNPGIPENVQNYMDYSPCKIMFTNGQADRMRSIIASNINGRNLVSSQDNLVATGIAGDHYVCVPTVDFRVNQRKTCTGQNLTFTSTTWVGLGNFSRQWTFEGGNPATSADSIVAVSFSLPGTYSVSLSISSPGGTTVETKQGYVVIVDPNQSESVPYFMDFETDSLVAKLIIENPDPQSVSWTRNQNLGANQTGKCFYLNSISDALEIRGEKDAFELPPLNLTGWNEVMLSYWYAYARPVASQRDSFKVQYSLDCGGTWKTISGLPTITQMAAASGGTTQNHFIPNASQWVQQIIPSSGLEELANRNGVKIRFLFVKDPAKTSTNNLYIDQIEVQNSITQNQEKIEATYFSIHPNPSNGTFFIRTKNKPTKESHLKLFDVNGRELKEQVEMNQTGDWLVNANKKLPKGVYWVMLEQAGQLFNEKLLVN